jgi:hypothetical protein
MLLEWPSAWSRATVGGGELLHPATIAAPARTATTTTAAVISTRRRADGLQVLFEALVLLASDHGHIMPGRCG